MTDNGQLTNEFSILTVIVLDLCIATTLTINDAIFKTKPTATITQFVTYDALSILWTDDSILSSSIGSLVDSKSSCGSITHEIVNQDGSTIDSSVFPSQDFSSDDKSLDVQTNDFSKSMPYNLKLIVYFTSYSSIIEYTKSEKEFLVEVKDYCVPISVNKASVFVPGNLSYTIF